MRVELITVRQWQRAGRHPSALQRAAASGRLVRVHSGAYAESAAWSEANADERYLARIEAVASRALSPLVFSHESAAALLGVPYVGAPRIPVHTRQPTLEGGSRSRLVVRHGGELGTDEVMQVDGLRCTTPLRTAVDLAMTREFVDGVVGMDHLMREHAVTADAALGLLAETEAIRSAEAARTVIGFGDPLAETVIESVSRANIHLLGYPPPVLQKSFFDARGFVGRPDFCWEEESAIAEADGRLKYLDERYRSGRSADRVVLEEKIREDRLRAIARRFTRWDWATATSPRLLAAKLDALGLVRTVRFRAPER